MATTTLLPIAITDATSTPFLLDGTTQATITVTGNIYNTTSPVTIYIEKETSAATWEKVLTIGNTLASLILHSAGNYRIHRPACTIPCGVDLN